MSSLTTKLTDAQKYGLSIRPKIGGFPIFAEALRSAGIEMNRWSLPSCQAIYQMKDGYVVQQGMPLVTGIHEIPNFDRDAIIKAVRDDQEGKSTFPEFLMAAWEAGVIGYDVDFSLRKVIYYGANGDSYSEEYPFKSLM